MQNLSTRKVQKDNVNIFEEWDRCKDKGYPWMRANHLPCTPPTQINRNQYHIFSMLVYFENSHGCENPRNFSIYYN